MGKLHFKSWCDVDLKSKSFPLECLRDQDEKDPDHFILECLRAHNHYRAQHGCPALHLSSQLCEYSQEWANHLAQKDHLCHRPHKQFGENLFVSYYTDHSLPDVTGSHPVDSWYSESKFYPFDKDLMRREIIFKTGHFTQLIWKSSSEFGVGQSISSTNKVFVVANYHPAGNVMSKLEENVPRRISTLHCHLHYVRKHHSRLLDDHLHHL